MHLPDLVQSIINQLKNYFTALRQHPTIQLSPMKLGVDTQLAWHSEIILSVPLSSGLKFPAGKLSPNLPFS